MPLLTIAVMLALHVPTPRVQQPDIRSWYQAYDDGKAAIGKNDAAAIASLEAAKRIGPKPARNINTYGDAIVTFNPDYYLGVAHLNLKHYAEADAAFKRAQQAQLIAPKEKEYALLTSLAAKAAFELGLESSAKALAGKQFDQALETARQAAKTRGISADDVRRAIDLSGRIEKAMAVPNPPASPTPTPSDPKSTPAPTPTPAASGNSTPTPTPKPSPTSAATPSPTPRPTNNPTKPLPTPPPVSPTLPSAISAGERAGMKLFFNGDYAGAAAQMRTVSYGKSPTARAHFYFACAQAGLVLIGRADRESLTEAQAYFEGARGDSEVFSADRQYVSPRILQLLGAKQ